MRREEERIQKLALEKKRLEMELAEKRRIEEQKALIAKLDKKEQELALKDLKIVNTRLSGLEEKAYKLVLSEIKRTTPYLYEQAMELGLKTSEELNEFILDDLMTKSI